MDIPDKELKALCKKAIDVRLNMIVKYGKTPSKINGNKIAIVSKKYDVSVIYGNTVTEPRIQIGFYAMDFREFVEKCNA